MLFEITYSTSTLRAPGSESKFEYVQGLLLGYIVFMFLLKISVSGQSKIKWIQSCGIPQVSHFPSSCRPILNISAFNLVCINLNLLIIHSSVATLRKFKKPDFTQKSSEKNQQKTRLGRQKTSKKSAPNCSATASQRYQNLNNNNNNNSLFNSPTVKTQKDYFFFRDYREKTLSEVMPISNPQSQTLQNYCMGYGPMAILHEMHILS